MKVKKIEEIDMIFIVTLEPRWIEKLFGVKEKVVEYKDTNLNYVVGGGHVYSNRKGEELPNGHYIATAIDKWRKRW